MDNDLNVLTLYNEKNMPRIKAFNSAVKSEYEVQTNYEQVDVNFEWLEIMEDTVRYLDNSLRNPNRFIVNEEEVVKVEQARRITVEAAIAFNDFAVFDFTTVLFFPSSSALKLLTVLFFGFEVEVFPFVEVFILFFPSRTLVFVFFVDDNFPTV